MILMFSVWGPVWKTEFEWHLSISQSDGHTMTMLCVRQSNHPYVVKSFTKESQTKS